MKKSVLISIIVAAVVLVAIAIFALSGGFHSHEYGSWETVNAPTCTQKGLQERTCKCGEAETREINATGHIYGGWNTVKAPTCTQKGLKERTCKCGKAETRDVAATGHTYGNWTTTEEATCTTNGSKERVCSCGEKETQIIVGGHSWESATCVDPKTCKKCNLTEGEALGHIGKIGSECTRCNQTIYPKVNVPTRMAVVHSSALGRIIIEIEEVSYKFTSSNRIKVSFSATVVEMYEEPLAKLTISVLDSDGYKIGSSSWMDVYPCNGDKYKESVSISLELDENCSEITIVIE